MADQEQISDGTAGGFEKLESPVSAHIARTNVEAQMLAIFLRDAGVHAVAVDDVSLAGYFMLGTIPNLHRPQIFVSKSDLPAAHALLAARLANQEPSQLPPFCFHCGAELPEGHRQGSCPGCGNEVDMSEENEATKDSDAGNGPSFAVLVFLAVVMLVPALVLFITGLLRML